MPIEDSDPPKWARPQPTFAEKRERLTLTGMFHRLEISPGEYPAGATSWLLRIERGGVNGVWISAEDAAKIRAYFAPDPAAMRAAAREHLDLFSEAEIDDDDFLNAIERIYR